MTRLFWYRDQVHFPIIIDSDNAKFRFLIQLSKQLENEMGFQVQREGNELLLTGSLFRFAHGINIPLSVENGKIMVQKENQEMVVVYELSYYRLIVLCSILIASIIFSIVAFPFNTIYKILIITIVGACLLGFGLNFVTTVYSFPRLVRSAWMKALYIEKDSPMAQLYGE